MEGVDISPATLLQSRSPSLDLDSLYGNGPGDPGSAQFYDADGIHLKMGAAQAGPAGLRPAAQGDAARRSSPTRGTTRTSPSRRSHCAFIRFHNRVVDTLRPRSRAAQRFRAARRIVTKHYQWMIRHDYLPQDLHAGDRHERLHARPQGVRGRRLADEHADDADRVLGCRLPARAQHGAGRLQLEQGLPGRHAGAAVRVLAPERRPARARSRTSGSPTSAGSSTSASYRRLNPASSCRPTKFNRRCGSTRSSSTRCAMLPVADPAPENNLAFRNLLRANMVKLATGQQMVTFLTQQGHRGDEADEGADPRTATAARASPR